MHVDLAGDLGAAEHGDERTLRAGRARAPRYSSSVCISSPATAGCSRCDALGRGVRAMRGAERVVHVAARRARASLRAKPASFFLLLGMEAQVLEQQHAAVRRARRGTLGVRTRRSRARTSQAFRAAPRAAPRPGASAVLGLRARPWGARDATSARRAAPRSVRLADRGQRGDDARVVRHRAVRRRAR